MQSKKRDGRPTLEGETATSPAKAQYRLTDLDDYAVHVDGAFVVVVAVTGGRYRRRCFLSAASAEAAAGKAVARGEIATVHLAELRPLWKLQAGEVR